MVYQEPYGIKNAGLLDKVLISHDAGWYDAGEPDGGGYRRYSDISGHLIPALRENGFSNQEISMLVSGNPSRAFEIKIRLLE
jgi:phosphotriesterase-related protein